jgi:hypothetical protein
MLHEKYFLRIVYEPVSSVQIGQEPKTDVFVPKPVIPSQSLVQITNSRSK